MEGGKPLVSIGIPTYNRFDGLRRTLQQITQQSYTNLEIIVSDNCSPNKEIKEVVEEFMLTDSRVKYFRQDKNIGITANFQFVLKQATGDFYMWASDDDEWDPLFIETCLKYIGEAGLVMQNRFKTVVRKTNRIITYKGPKLSIENSTFDNVLLFYRNTTPPLFYGLYRRETILPFLKVENMDIIDVFILLKHILHYGINTFSEQLYTSGVDGEDYEYKPIKESKKRMFRYRTLLKNILKEIRLSKRMSFKQKVIISKVYFLKILWYYTNYEKSFRPRSVKVVAFLLRVLIYINNIICKLTKTQNYYLIEASDHEYYKEVSN